MISKLIASMATMIDTIIGVVGQKGGVGKSTISRALASQAADDGLRVKLIDLDPQNTTVLDWHRRRLKGGIEPIFSVELYQSISQALAITEEYDLLILDAPARSSMATLEIAKIADLVVQPTSSSLDDLDPAIRVFHELVKKGIPREKLVFALSRLLTEAGEKVARDYILDARYMALEGSLYERAAYEMAQSRGLSVTETPYPSLNKKADQLIQSIVNQLKHG